MERTSYASIFGASLLARFRRAARHVALPCLIGFGLFVAQPSSAQPPVEHMPVVKQSEFTRFVDQGRERGRFETAVVSYKNKEGVTVDLIAAVHVGDRSYYRNLERRFSAYDAMLYELIHDKGNLPKPGQKSGSMVGMFQRLLTDVLALDFQLDAIDYTADNFVHADLDPATFTRLQKERGETILALLMRSAMQAFEQQQNQQRSGGSSSQLQLAQLISALMSDDVSRSLKYLMAQELENMEQVIAGMEPGGRESVILTERNKHAFKVLEGQLESGKKRLALFYGAAHMPDLEVRLRAIGFERAKHEWVTAWQIGPVLKTEAAPTPEAKHPEAKRKIETF